MAYSIKHSVFSVNLVMLMIFLISALYYAFGMLKIIESIFSLRDLFNKIKNIDKLLFSFLVQFRYSDVFSPERNFCSQGIFFNFCCINFREICGIPEKKYG